MAASEVELARSDTSDDEASTVGFCVDFDEEERPSLVSDVIPKLVVLSTAAIFQHKFIIKDPRQAAIVVNYLDDAKLYLDTRTSRRHVSTHRDNLDQSGYNNQSEVALKLLVGEHDDELENIAVCVDNNLRETVSDRLTPTDNIIHESSPSDTEEIHSSGTPAIVTRGFAALNATMQSRSISEGDLTSIQFLDLEYRSSAHATRIISPASFLFKVNGNMSMDAGPQKNAASDMVLGTNGLFYQEGKSHAAQERNAATTSSNADSTFTLAAMKDVEGPCKVEREEQGSMVPAANNSSDASKNLEPILKAEDLEDIKPNIREIKPEGVEDDEVIVLDDSSDEATTSKVVHEKADISDDQPQDLSIGGRRMERKHAQDNGGHKHESCVRCVECSKNIDEIDITLISSDEEAVVIKKEVESESLPTPLTNTASENVSHSNAQRSRLSLGKRRIQENEGEIAHVHGTKRQKSIPVTFFNTSDYDDDDDNENRLDSYTYQAPKTEMNTLSASVDNYTKLLMQAASKSNIGGRKKSTVKAIHSAKKSTTLSLGRSAVFLPLMFDTQLKKEVATDSSKSAECNVSSSTATYADIDSLNKIACAAQVSEFAREKIVEDRDRTIEHLKAELLATKQKLDDSETTLKQQTADLSETNQQLEHYRERSKRYRTKSKSKTADLELLTEKYEELKKMYSEQQLQHSQISGNTVHTVTQQEEVQISIIQEHQTLVQRQKSTPSPESCEKSTSTVTDAEESLSPSAILLRKVDKNETNEKRKLLSNTDLPSDLDDLDISDLPQREDTDSNGTPSSQFTLASAANRVTSFSPEKEENTSLIHAGQTTDVPSKNVTANGAVSSSKSDVETVTLSSTTNGTQENEAVESSPVFGKKKEITSPISSTQRSPPTPQESMAAVENGHSVKESGQDLNHSDKDTKLEELKPRERLRTCLLIASTLKEAVELGLKTECEPALPDDSNEYKALMTMCEHLNQMQESVGPLTKSLDSSDSETIDDSEEQSSDDKSVLSQKEEKSLHEEKPQVTVSDNNSEESDTDFSAAEDKSENTASQRVSPSKGKQKEVNDGLDKDDDGDSASLDLDLDLRSRIKAKYNASPAADYAAADQNIKTVKCRKRKEDDKNIISPPKVARLSAATMDRSIMGTPTVLRAPFPQRRSRMSNNPPPNLISQGPKSLRSNVDPIPKAEVTTHLYSDVYNRGRGKSLGVTRNIGRRSQLAARNEEAVNLSGHNISSTPATSTDQSSQGKRNKAGPNKNTKGQGRRKSKKTAQKSVKESSQDVTTIETEDEAARDALNTLEQATVSKLAEKKVDDKVASNSSSSSVQVTAVVHDQKKEATTSHSKQAVPPVLETQVQGSKSAESNGDDDSGSQMSIEKQPSIALEPLLINHLQGQPLSDEQKNHEMKLYSPTAQQLQDILNLHYVAADEPIMVQNLQKGNSQVVKNRKGKDSLYYATVKQIDDYVRAEVLKRDFLSFVGNSLITRFSEIIRVFLFDNKIKMTPQDYYICMQDQHFRPDALTIVLLGIFLETNIDVVTPHREWTMLEQWPQEIVLGYNGNGNFHATAKLRNLNDKKQSKKKGKKLSKAQQQALMDRRQLEGPNQDKVKNEGEATENDEGNISKFDCYLCDDVKPKSRAEKRLHLATVHLTREVFCLICDVDLLDHENCMQHIKEQHEIRLYSCERCGRNFTTKTALEKHVELHNAILQYKCQLCNKGMRSEVHLKAHLHRHAQLKVNSCRYCKKTFVTIRELQRHVNYVHTAKPSVRCELCGKFYKSRENVKKHQNQHHKLREIPCPKCEKIFTVTQTYLNHVERQHHLPRHLPFREEMLTV